MIVLRTRKNTATAASLSEDLGSKIPASLFKDLGSGTIFQLNYVYRTSLWTCKKLTIFRLMPTKRNCLLTYLLT